MLCPPCSRQQHERCEYPTSCTCQHKPLEKKDELKGDRDS